jgi:hypothetical protein
MARRPQRQPLDHQEERQRPWRRRQRDIAYIAWASFLMACSASAVFFAMVDPLVLSGTTTPGWDISREAGYAIGFFGFWLLTAATGAFVLWLVRTENGAHDDSGTRRQANGRKHGRRGLWRRRDRHDADKGREEGP